MSVKTVNTCKPGTLTSDGSNNSPKVSNKNQQSYVTCLGSISSDVVVSHAIIYISGHVYAAEIHYYNSLNTINNLVITVRLEWT